MIAQQDFKCLNIQDLRRLLQTLTHVEPLKGKLSGVFWTIVLPNNQSVLNLDVVWYSASAFDVKNQDSINFSKSSWFESGFMSSHKNIVIFTMTLAHGAWCLCFLLTSSGLWLGTLPLRSFFPPNHCHFIELWTLTFTDARKPWLSA